MNFTLQEFAELSALDLSKDEWPEWLCEKYLKTHPGKSKRHYGSMWNRGWRFVYRITEKVNLVKVIGFPGGETMWVELVTGHENEGTGTLANDPVCSSLKHGDLVAFNGGTDTLRPRYVGQVGETTVKPPGHDRETSSQLETKERAERGHDRETTVKPPGQNGETHGELVVLTDERTLYTNTTPPLGGDSNNTQLAILDVDGLQEATRSALAANGVVMRWSKKQKNKLNELISLHGFNDVKLVLQWWSTSQDFRARQLRGLEPWPDGAFIVRKFQTIINKFEEYWEFATTKSVAPMNEPTNQPQMGQGASLLALARSKKNGS